MPKILSEDFIEAVDWLSKNATDETSRSVFSDVHMKYMLSDIDVPSEIPLPEKRRGRRPLSAATWAERRKNVSNLEEVCAEFGGSIRGALQARAERQAGPDATKEEVDRIHNQLIEAHYRAKRQA